MFPDEDLSVIVDFILVQLKSRNDRHFRLNLLTLIRTAIQNNRQLSSLAFDKLIQHVLPLKEISPSVSFAKQLICFSKLCSLFIWTDLNLETQKRLVEAHSILCTFFSRSKSKSLYDLNYKFLKQTLISCNLDGYFEILSGMTSNLQTCILCDNVIRFTIEFKISTFFNAHKTYILDSFVKGIVMMKTKICNTVESFCFANTLSQLDFNDFKTTLFPTIQKAVLRSAETSLVLISFLLELLNFDLSDLSQGLILVSDTLIRVF